MFTLLKKIDKIEFLIRRLVLEEEKNHKRRIKWTITHSGENLASGLVDEGDLKILSIAIRKAKEQIRFPSPEEIEAKRVKEEEEYHKHREKMAALVKKSNVLNIANKKKTFAIKIPKNLAILLDDPSEVKKQ